MYGITVSRTPQPTPTGFGIDENGQRTPERQAAADRNNAQWQQNKQTAVNAGAGSGFDANAYVASMDKRQLDNLIVNGPNLASKEERSAAIAAAEMRLKSMRSSTPAPSTSGMSPTGQQQGVQTLPPPDFPPASAGGQTPPPAAPPAPPPTTAFGQDVQAQAPRDPQPNYQTGGLLRPPETSDSSAATVGPSGFARGSMGQVLNAPAYASVTSQPRHHTMTYAATRDQVMAGRGTLDSVSAPASPSPMRTNMANDVGNLESIVRRNPAFQQLEALTQSLGGRDPSPEEEQEMSRLVAAIQADPNYLTLQQRMNEMTQGLLTQ